MPIWESQLQCDPRNDKLKENFHNFALILENHAYCEGKFRFNEFSNKAMFDGIPVTDVVEGDILRWLCAEFKFGGNQPKVLTRAIDQVSRLSKYDELKEWLVSLPDWDKTPRLNKWLIDWCGAEESATTAWIGYVTIMQLAVRAINPGVQARYVTVLEGPENIGKTRAIKILGDPWTRTFDISMENKEAHMAIQGVWLSELSELDTLRKTAETRLKSFISQTEDTYIPKYANHAVVHPRRTVFMGTTNEDIYLPGMGNTRFLPVKTKSFNLPALKANRDQLISEAIHVYLRDPQTEWWQVPGVLQESIAQARDARRVVNVYEGELSRWLDGGNGGHYMDRVTWRDIATGFLAMDSPQHWKDRSLQGQIAQALRSLGWTPSNQRINKIKTRCWVRSQ